MCAPVSNFYMSWCNITLSPAVVIYPCHFFTSTAVYNCTHVSPSRVLYETRLGTPIILNPYGLCYLYFSLCFCTVTSLCRLYSFIHMWRYRRICIIIPVLLNLGILLNFYVCCSTNIPMYTSIHRHA